MTRSIASTQTKSKSSKQRSRAVVKLILQTALREKFPHDTIDISDGYEDNIHVLVVSRLFDEMGEKSRWAYLWKIVENTNLNRPEKDLITILLAVSPRELK